MVETLLDKSALWLTGDGPDAEIVVNTYGVLARNLADFPFPARCSEDERRTIEERVLGALDSAPTLSGGQYLSMQRLERKEARFLSERCLAAPDLAASRGARGVYVAEDQCACVMINGGDHIVIQVMASGMQPSEVWLRLNAIDDALAAILDYAFDKRLGYLTSSISQVGTGLMAAVIGHFPGLAMNNAAGGIESRMNRERHTFDGLFKANGTTLGDLYVLSNQATLGRSEDETIFHLKHLAHKLVTDERAARETTLQQLPRGIQDRVGRALGIARGARLLEFGEALTLLSSIRLGVATGNAEGCSIQSVNELLLASQNGHLEMKAGHACDDLTLSMERADLFRARFS
ncbi:MAG: hypothetical protein HZB26_24475 [Candidatus Hydrogenedentes bacterium]|nr:hypothetical protein [Candidatus Hydrogenedentota bacterium]